MLTSGLEPEVQAGSKQHKGSLALLGQALEDYRHF